MTDNPYAPPKATVADPVIRATPASRPLEATLAVRLLWLGVALGVLNLAIDSGQAIVAGSLPPAAFASSVFSIGFTAWLTHNIARGRNWARVTSLVLSVLGLPLLFWVLPALRDRSMLVTVTTFVITALQIVALYLVFTGSGARWFRRGQ